MQHPCSIRRRGMTLHPGSLGEPGACSVVCTLIQCFVIVKNCADYFVARLILHCFHENPVQLRGGLMTFIRSAGSVAAGLQAFQSSTGLHLTASP